MRLKFNRVWPYISSAFQHYLYKRSGTLWEERYWASAVDAENYLFECMRYIELNPVRAGMVAHPRDFQWSSYRANAEGGADLLRSPHALCWSLAGNESERRAISSPEGRPKRTAAD